MRGDNLSQYSTILSILETIYSKHCVHTLLTVETEWSALTSAMRYFVQISFIAIFWLVKGKAGF